MRDPFTFEGNYGDLLQVKLAEVIAMVPSRSIVLVIRKTLENLVLAERLSAARGVEITDLDRYYMLQHDYAGVQAEVDRALGEFIGSILSAEGG
jgi:hypothetical protein